MEEMANVNIEYLINTLEQKKVSVVTRKKHSYIMYQGIESEYIYVLKDGVAKISNILRDGREFNIAYVAQPDFVSLLEEKQNDGISALFNVRVESPTANFYKISRSDFWDWVREDLNLFRVVDDFYKINRELSLYADKLTKMPQVIAANKIDLPQAKENLPRLEELAKKDKHLKLLISMHEEAEKSLRDHAGSLK